MNDNRSGGTLLVAGNVIGIFVMAVHPVGGHGLLAPHDMQMLALRDRVVHGFAIALLPMVFLGALALSQWLRGAGRLPLAALVVFGFAVVAIMAAGAMSGFVGADILGRMVEGDPKLESRRMLLDYTFRINQAFASIYAVGSCVAIAMWSAVIVRTRQLAPALGIYGLLIGLAIPAALFAGVLTLDVHGMGLVALAQAVWFVSAGWALRRAGAAEKPLVEVPA